MSAFLIVHRREITDPETLKQYRDGIDQTIVKFGGRPLVRMDGFEVLEGGWDPGRPNDDSQPERITVIEFPDMGQLKDWYGSEEYAELKALRQASSVCDVVAVEGSQTR